MIWGSRFRPFPIRAVLCFALAIQALTPDPHDVVSVRGLYVLCGVPLPLESLGDDLSEQETAVCRPFGQQRIVELRRIIDRVSRVRTTSPSPRMSHATMSRNLPEAIEPLGRLHEQLCITLCRLAC
jgi:hypothetical protein